MNIMNRSARTNQSRNFKMALLGSALATGILCAPAFAQDEPESKAIETTRTNVDGRDIIVVTARNYVPEGSQTANKTNIPLIETPQSISVITRDQIDLLNFIDAQQAVRYTAGVFGENYGPDLRFDFLTVRGFTPKQYIDGLAAPISTSIYSVGVDLYAFESFDLLKGPSSVLYGNVPPGGIYNQVSRRAESRFGGELAVKYGTDNYKQVAGTVTGAIADDVDVRLTGLYRDRDAERDHVSAERAMIAPTATYKIGPATELTGLFYYQYDKVRGDTNGFLPVYGTLLPNPIGMIDPGTNLGDPRNVYKRKQFGAGVDFSHEFSSSLAFRSNTKWSDYEERTPIGIYGGGGLTNITNPALPNYYREVARYNFSYAEDVASFASDNRLDGNFATGEVEHKVLVGFDYRNVRNKADFGFVFDPPPIDLFNPQYGPVPTLEPGYPFGFNNQRLKQSGLYGQDQLQFGNVFLTLGGRYDWVKIRNNSTMDTTSQKKFTWWVGANYVSDSGIAPYVSYATSFEPVLGTDSITMDEFKPTTGKQLEGGIKFDARGLPDDVKLFATAAAFKINQKNVVSTSPSVTPVFGTQSGEVEVYGGEFEIVARIRDQWSINASYSYNHSEVTASQTAAEIGSPLPTTPKHKLSAFIDYTIQEGSLGGLGFGIGGRHTSTSAGALPGPFNPVVYFGEKSTLFDAIVHYDTPEWRFAVNGSNIFDKTYVARCSGPAGCTYGAGRQVIGTVTKKF